MVWLLCYGLQLDSSDVFFISPWIFGTLSRLTLWPNVSANPPSRSLSAMRPGWNGVESGIPAILTIHPPGLRFPSPGYLLTYCSTYAVSVIVLAAAILLVILDGVRLDILIQWWAEQSSLLTRVSCLPGTLVGVRKTFDYEAY